MCEVGREASADQPSPKWWRSARVAATASRVGRPAPSSVSSSRRRRERSAYVNPTLRSVRSSGSAALLPSSRSKADPPTGRLVTVQAVHCAFAACTQSVAIATAASRVIRRGTAHLTFARGIASSAQRRPMEKTYESAGSRLWRSGRKTHWFLRQPTGGGRMQRTTGQVWVTAGHSRCQLSRLLSTWLTPTGPGHKTQ